MLMENIGRRVEAERRRLRMTQAQVADVLGVVQAAYSRKELGKTAFSVHDIVKLSDLTGCSVGYFVTGKTEPQSLLSEEEWRLIKAYRKADEKGKADIMTTAFDAML